MNQNTEKLIRRAAEAEEMLAGLTELFALLPLPTAEPDRENGHGTWRGQLTRQMGKVNRIAEGLRAVDGEMVGLGADGGGTLRQGAGHGDERTVGAHASSGGGTSDPGLYRETRALRRLSELMLRT